MGVAGSPAFIGGWELYCCCHHAQLNGWLCQSGSWHHHLLLLLLLRRSSMSPHPSSCSVHAGQGTGASSGRARPRPPSAATTTMVPSGAAPAETVRVVGSR